jgi:hypothetical protein
MKPRQFKRIWGKPWDYGYLLQLEKYKMSEMMRYFAKNQRFVGWEDVVRDLRICIKLIDIINEADDAYKAWLHTSYGINHHEVLFPKYINTRNKHRFLTNDYLNQNSRVYQGLLAHYRSIKALYLYNKIRTYKMCKWWS